MLNVMVEGGRGIAAGKKLRLRGKQRKRGMKKGKKLHKKRGKRKNIFGL